MVRVPATASLLRTFQPHPEDALCCDYSGLRPIYATQSHPKMLTLAHIQSLSGAKLRSGSESPNARSCLENRERSFHLSQNENHHFTLCLQGCGRFHARKIGEPPTGNTGDSPRGKHRGNTGDSPREMRPIPLMETRLPAASLPDCDAAGCRVSLTNSQNTGDSPPGKSITPTVGKGAPLPLRLVLRAFQPAEKQRGQSL